MSFDILKRLGSHLPDSLPHRPHRSRLQTDRDHCVGGIPGILEIDEEAPSSISLPNTPLQFPIQACLPHPAFRGEQRVRTISNSALQFTEIGLAVEEPIPIDPVPNRLSQHSPLIPNSFVANSDVGTVPGPCQVLYEPAFQSFRRESGGTVVLAQPGCERTSLRWLHAGRRFERPGSA